MVRFDARAFETPADVGRVFAALGYQECDLPAVAGRVVARWGTFRIVAVGPGADPRRTAQEVARRLAQDGERGLAVGWNRGELAVCAPRPGLNGCTKTLAIGIARPEPGQLELLARLAPQPRRTALEHALRVADVLSTETAGHRFFTAFRHQVDRMAEALDPGISVEDRRLGAFLALTRMLFLYFVQAKGWLAGRPEYLRELLDAALGAGAAFHRDTLDPLLFGTLNRPRTHRAAGERFGDVPYLNGGLFEPHPVERRRGPMHFPNELWRQAFDDVFERFRFCVREADEVNAIAPDMLGRVFERLMDTEERGDSGTFYTPEPVVRQLVHAALVTALKSRGIDPETARQAVACQPLPADSAGRVRALLWSLRILDPAVGSGAFLLGALECLTAIHSALDRDPALSKGTLRREILRRNLFGVDVHPLAVRLAELRLWLAVIADDPTREIRRVTPLPNLDGIVRQGDTLFDPVSAMRSWGALQPPKRLSERVFRARLALYEARGSRHRRALNRLRRSETALARYVLSTARARCERELRELAARASSRDLFGKRVGLGAEERRRQRAAQHNRLALIRAWDALAEGRLPFFSFEIHLPELAAEGFSLVIGNPPWVRAERVPPELRERLRHRYRWWRAGEGRGYRHQPDLSIAFLERALELTADGGTVAMLMPSKVASAGYGTTARQHLVRETTIEYLHRVTPADARFGATAYPLAIVLRKAAPRAGHEVQLGFQEGGSLQQQALSAAPWMLVPNAAASALTEFAASGESLERLGYPILGVKTGADGLLVGRLLDRGEEWSFVAFGTRRVKLETWLLRPALRGRDVHPFQACPARVVLWAHDSDGSPLRRLPPLGARYIGEIASRLRARTDYAGGPLWRLFRTRSAVGPNRVVWADIARRPRALVVDASAVPDAVPLNTCYVFAAPDRSTALCLAVVLNSTWAAAFLAASAAEAQAGYRRMNAQTVARVPLPAGRDERVRLAQLGEAAHRGESIAPEALDHAVADALGLSCAARRGLCALARDYRL